MHTCRPRAIAERRARTKTVANSRHRLPLTCNNEVRFLIVYSIHKIESAYDMSCKEARVLPNSRSAIYLNYANMTDVISWRSSDVFVSVIAFHENANLESRG